MGFLKHSVLVGLTFGVTSGTITTLGLMVGINAGTGSRLAVIGAILTIAIADAFSDALGIHISEEAENVHTTIEVWTATISTFLCKFIFALTFIIPVFLLTLQTAVIVSVLWGLAILTVMSYLLAKEQHVKAWKVVVEHLFIAVLVITLTQYLGMWISAYFGA